MSGWIILFVLSLFLTSCEDKPNPKEAVIQQEVSRRVETIREDLKADQDRRYTLRMVTLCLLAGGSLIGLFRLGDDGSWFPSGSSLPDSHRESPLPGRRIIEPSRPNPQRRTP